VQTRTLVCHTVIFLNNSAPLSARRFLVPAAHGAGGGGGRVQSAFYRMSANGRAFPHAFIERYFIFVQMCVDRTHVASRVQRAGRAPAHFSAEPRGTSTRRHHPMPAPPAPGARRMLPLHCTVAWQLRHFVSQSTVSTDMCDVRNRWGHPWRLCSDPNDPSDCVRAPAHPAVSSTFRTGPLIEARVLVM
jgi:hypothetical protein